MAAPPPLPPLVPPLRYCLVEEGLYRGAYPSLVNLRFLTRLGLRSMVSLLPEPPAAHLLQWCEEHGVRNHFECVAPFKEEVTLSNERAAELLQLLVLPERQPVYVHCLDGVGVTGMIIMCLRKLLRWAPSSIVAEYARYSRDGWDVPSPPPPHILAFLHAWKPDFEFLPRHLPTDPPLWLEVALQPVVETHAPAGTVNGSVDRSGGTSAARLLPREPMVDEREYSGYNGGGGERDVLEPTSSLDALAIEGLTVGSRRGVGLAGRPLDEEEPRHEPRTTALPSNLPPMRR